MASDPSFGSFFRYIWWWNILIDLIILGLLIFFFLSFGINPPDAVRADDAVLNLVVLGVAVLHALLLLVLAVIKAIKRQWLYTVILLLHAAVPGVLAYLLMLSGLLLIGFTGTR